MSDCSLTPADSSPIKTQPLPRVFWLFINERAWILWIAMKNNSLLIISGTDRWEIVTDFFTELQEGFPELCLQETSLGPQHGPLTTLIYLCLSRWLNFPKPWFQTTRIITAVLLLALWLGDARASCLETAGGCLGCHIYWFTLRSRTRGFFPGA